ncbi:MAG: LptA/OstA family protein [Lentisphaeria bacterium]
MKNNLFVVTVLVAILSVESQAQESKKNLSTIPASRVERLEITANSSDVDYEKRELVFVGNVKVKDPQVDLESDRLVVYFSEKQDIKSFKATGNNRDISIILRRDGQEDVIASGEEALYNAETGRIILKGEKTSLLNGANKIVGAKQIEFFINDKGITDFKTIGRAVFTINRKSGLLRKDEK